MPVNGHRSNGLNRPVSARVLLHSRDSGDSRGEGSGQEENGKISALKTNRSAGWEGFLHKVSPGPELKTINVSVGSGFPRQ